MYSKQTKYHKPQLIRIMKKKVIPYSPHLLHIIITLLDESFVMDVQSKWMRKIYQVFINHHQNYVEALHGKKELLNSKI